MQLADPSQQRSPSFHAQQGVPLDGQDLQHLCRIGTMSESEQGSYEFEVEDVHSAIVAAERILPGVCAPEGEIDDRWQALMKIEDFVQSDPEPIWNFAVKWGCHQDQDLRTAVAVLLLEHLLEYHFDLIFPRVEAEAMSNSLFADTFKGCWKFGEAEDPRRSALFDRLVGFLQKPTGGE
jgi:hypothetical protein